MAVFLAYPELNSIPIFLSCKDLFIFQQALNSHRISQNELRPENPVGPCLFRSLQAAAEEKTGENLTLEQITQSGKTLHDSKAIGEPDEFYYVIDPVAVVKDALTTLGYPNAKVTIGITGASTGEADYTIRFIESRRHFQLGDSQGNLLYEPYDYNTPSNGFTGAATSLRDVTIYLKGK